MIALDRIRMNLLDTIRHQLLHLTDDDGSHTLHQLLHPVE